jgi:hypothetical protein
MKIAIQGHPTRGKEIIQILRSLGATSYGTYDTCSHPEWYWYINKNKEITCDPKRSMCDHKLYTLEEFEKEFPFKIGDEVTIVGIPDFPKTITKMEWDRDEILYSFEGLVNTWFGAKALKKFEMKEERNITLTLDKAQEWYKKGGELKEIALQAFTENELNPQLPRSWEEFCKQGNPVASRRYNIPIKYEALFKLEQLRNCWWSDWKPEWNNCEKYVIKWDKDDLIVFTARNIRAFLVFPTREMAYEFLKCFRYLIEQAGDLI